MQLGEADLWKYMDGTTIAEVVDKGQELYPASGRRSRNTSKG